MIRILNARFLGNWLTKTDKADLVGMDLDELCTTQLLEYNRCFAHKTQLLTLDAFKTDIGSDDNGDFVWGVQLRAGPQHAGNAWILVDTVRDVVRFLRRRSRAGSSGVSKRK